MCEELVSKMHRPNVPDIEEFADEFVSAVQGALKIWQF